MTRFEDIVRTLLTRLRRGPAGHFVAPRPEEGPIGNETFPPTAAAAPCPACATRPAGRHFAVSLTPKPSPPFGPIPSPAGLPLRTPRPTPFPASTPDPIGPALSGDPPVLPGDPYSAPSCRWGSGNSYVPPLPSTPPSVAPSGGHRALRPFEGTESGEPTGFETQVFRLYD